MGSVAGETGGMPAAAKIPKGGSLVKEEARPAGKVYVCEVCGFAYEEKEWAEKCQKWCTEHDSCNLEITDHAVGS